MFYMLEGAFVHYYVFSVEKQWNSMILFQKYRSSLNKLCAIKLYTVLFDPILGLHRRSIGKLNLLHLSSTEGWLVLVVL